MSDASSRASTVSAWRSPRRVARTASAFVALVYLLLVVILLLAALAPLAAGWKQVVIRSGSMAPTIRVGSVALLEPAKEDEFYDTPTVITFRDLRSGDLVTHRVVDVEQDDTGAVLYTTQGDANREADPLAVPHANVAGSVRAVVPYIGWPAVWLQRGMIVPLGLWLAATALLAATLVWYRPVKDESSGHDTSDAT